MVNVRSTDDQFIFEIKGWYKLWAFKNSITVPKENIVKAFQSEEEFGFFKGFRFPGTEVPGIIAAGTFYKRGWNFWTVRNKKKAIIVELKNETYNKLIIQVKNPEETLKLLNQK